MKTTDPDIELGVVIVSYNVSPLLRNCLLSLNGKLPPVSNKILVVDNCSDDNSADMVRNDFPDCVLLVTNRNIGFGRANNLGVKAIRAKYYLILNPDTEISNDIVAKMLAHIKANPGTGVVGCRMLMPTGEIQPSIYTLPNLVSTISGILQLKQLLSVKYLQVLIQYASLLPTVKEYMESGRNVSEWEKTQAVPGSCFLVDGSLWNKMGGFDENIFLYREDADLFYRITHVAGSEIHLLPDTGVLHHVGKSFKTKFTPMSPYKHWSTLYYFRKNHGLFHYFVIATFLFSAACARFLIAFFSHFESDSQKHQYLRDCLLVMKISVLGLNSFDPFPSSD